MEVNGSPHEARRPCNNFLISCRGTTVKHFSAFLANLVPRRSSRDYAEDVSSVWSRSGSSSRERIPEGGSRTLDDIHERFPRREEYRELADRLEFQARARIKGRINKNGHKRAKLFPLFELRLEILYRGPPRPDRTGPHRTGPHRTGGNPFERSFGARIYLIISAMAGQRMAKIIPARGRGRGGRGGFEFPETFALELRYDARRKV